MLLTKYTNQIKAFFKQGLSLHEMSLTITLGFFLGIIPLLGINSILCVLLAIKLRLNLPVLMAVNYLLFPLQLILMLPFIELASKIFGLKSATAVVFNSPGAFDWFQFLSNLGMANILALFIWAAFFILFGWPFYKGLFLFLKQFNPHCRVPTQKSTKIG